MPAEPGLNRFIWEDQRYPGAEELEGHPTRSERDIGPHAVPGMYKVELVIDGVSQTQEFSILADPNSSASQRDLEAQFEFVSDVRDTITHLNRTVLAIRQIREDIYARSETADEPSAEARALDDQLYRMEDVLTAYDVEYRMQYMAIPVRLDDKLYTLAERALSGNSPPTEAQRALFGRFSAEYGVVHDSMQAFLETDLQNFNQRLTAAGSRPIDVPAHLRAE